MAGIFFSRAATQPITSELLLKHGVLLQVQIFVLPTVERDKGFVGPVLKVLKEATL